MAIVLIGLISCGKDEVVTPPVLEIATTEISFGAAEGNQMLDVKTNGAIAAVSNHPEWCTATVPEGESAKLRISVSANPDETDRTAIVTVSATGTTLLPVEIKVTQSLTAKITIAQEYLTLSFPGNVGGLRNIPVQTTGNKPITATSSEEWCKVSLSGFMLNVSAPAQTPGSPVRTAEITVAAEGMESKIISVEQTVFAGYVNIADISHLAHHLKGETNTSVYVTILNNIPFAAASNQTWCTITQFDNETRHQIKIAAPKNETGAERTAQITVTGGAEPIVITLTQDAANHQTGFPRFAVLSDTHFDNTEGAGESSAVKVPRAVKNLTQKGNLDAMFVVGDITDHGNEPEYVNLLATFTNPEIVPTNLPVYYLLGNHDQSGSGLTGEYFFLKYLHQSMNQYLEIKGYPFILISQTNSTVWDFNHAAQRFLKESLVDAAENYPGKPIFVFVHVPPRNTCYGSSESDGWGSPVWNPILEPYPQVIVFAGHSHFPIGDPRSIWQGQYTSVNDGSTNFSELEPGLINGPGNIHPANIDINTGETYSTYNKVTEGLIVNLTDGGTSVVMERWDTRRNEEILPQWTVRAPFDGSNFPFEYKGRTGLPAPLFDENSAEQIKVNTANNRVLITFPQATDDEVVHHYIISIKDAENNSEVTKQTVFSQFYLNSETPGFLMVEFLGLPAGKQLKVEIIAVDSYYANRSGAIVKSFMN
jgi:Icc-related predicted phosphoesterase